MLYVALNVGQHLKALVNINSFQPIEGSENLPCSFMLTYTAELILGSIICVLSASEPAAQHSFVVFNQQWLYLHFFLIDDLIMTGVTLKRVEKYY